MLAKSKCNITVRKKLRIEGYGRCACLCKWTVMSPLEGTANNSHCYLKINIASH